MHIGLVLLFSLIFSISATFKNLRLSELQSSISHRKRTIKNRLYNSNKLGIVGRRTEHAQILEIIISSGSEGNTESSIEINIKTSETSNACENITNLGTTWIEKTNDIDIGFNTEKKCDESITKGVNLIVTKHGFKDDVYGVGRLDSEEERGDEDDRKEIISQEFQKEEYPHLTEEDTKDFYLDQNEKEIKGISPMDIEPLHKGPWEIKSLEECPKKITHIKPPYAECSVMTKIVEVTVTVTEHEIKTITEAKHCSQTPVFAKNQESWKVLKTHSENNFPKPSAKLVLAHKFEPSMLATGINELSASRNFLGSMPSETTFSLTDDKSPIFTGTSVRLDVKRSMFFPNLVISFMAAFFLS